MPKITYIEYSGRQHQVEVPLGRSVMCGAVDNDIPGIDADCGGQCACATCHVYVDESWLGTAGLPVVGSQEAAMLSYSALIQPNSRLSCQIKVSEPAQRPDCPDAGRAALTSPETEASR